MAYLDQFSADERSLLVSLPYRTGLWVSSCDSTGGHIADTQELEALEKTIQALAQGMFESALVHEIMSESFLRRAAWPEWAKNYSTLPENCKRAIGIMTTHKIPARDIDAYRHILMQIGLDVARAFREVHTNEPMLHKITRGVGIAIDRFFGALQGDSRASEDLLNISYEEDLALNTLAQSLRGNIDHAAEHAGTIMNS